MDTVNENPGKIKPFPLPIKLEIYDSDDSVETDDMSHTTSDGKEIFEGVNASESLLPIENRTINKELSESDEPPTKRKRRSKQDPTEIIPYNCKYCGKQFPGRGGLETHERVHTGERPYKCSFCGKTFARKGDTQLHERIHTGEAPYKCKFCGKKMKQRSNLLQHERTHTGEKPYKCHICEKAFNQKTHLVQHERSHTGAKPFICEFCEKSFSIKQNLLSHIQKHNRTLSIHQCTRIGDDLFKCLKCRKVLSYDRMARHLLSHEKKNKNSTEKSKEIIDVLNLDGRHEKKKKKPHKKSTK